MAITKDDHMGFSFVDVLQWPSKSGQGYDPVFPFYIFAIMKEKSYGVYTLEFSYNRFQNKVKLKGQGHVLDLWVILLG